MNMRKTVVALLALFLGVGFWAAGCRKSEGESESRPKGQKDDLSDSSLARVVGTKGMNVLYVSVDTTRADHLGCYGHPLSKTPHIDRFASEGARFAQCISSAPLTLVSHSTMMTGSYQFVHGARDNTAFKLAPENTTLAEIFLEAGYTTHAEVATIILDPQFGLNQGFEVYNGVPPVQEPGVAGGKRVIDAEDSAPETDPVDEQLGQLKTDRLAVSITDAAIEKLRTLKTSDKPFFMFLHYYDPHWPQEAPEEFAKQFVDPYLAEIAYFDFHFGRLIDEVDRLGLAEKTLIILVSDHGEGKGEHGERTHSCFIYDSTLHVPCIMRCRGVIPAGLVVKPQVRLIDMAPTILEFVGMESLKTPQMQGASLLPLLANPGLTPGLQAYADSIVPQMMFGYSPLRALRTDEHKYIHAPAPELYDLTQDPLEVFNRAPGDEALTREMRQLLYDLIANSPAPPGSRATVSASDEETLEKLRALGYIGTDDSLEGMSQGSELDQFEPVGDNPRDHIEEIELLTGGMGAVRIADFEKAEIGLRRLVELRPDHKLAVGTLATALWGQKKYEEAEIWFRKAIELDPKECRLRRQLGVVLRNLKKYGEAEKAFRDGLACSNKDAANWSDLAGILYEQRRYEECIEAINEADRLSPGSPLNHTQRALARCRLKQFDKAVEDIDRAIRIEPSMPRAHSTKAIILSEMGKPEEAISYLKGHLEKYPDDAMSRNQLASFYLARRDVDAAARELATIVEKDEKAIDARLLLAGIQSSRGQKAEAITLCRKAVELDPDSRAAHVHLAAALVQNDEFAEAMDVYRNMLEKWPQPQLYRDVANFAAMRLKQESVAIDLLRKCIQEFPEDAASYNDLAWRLATTPDDQLRDGKQALELAKRANGFAESDNPFFLDTLAAALAETGDFKQAADIARRAKALALDMKAEAVANEIAGRIELYEKQKPYREKPPATK